MAGKIKGFTLIELMIVIAVIAVIAAIAIPGLISSQRSSYERGASTSMKTIAVAEADFKVNDRDGNHVADYWTADVKGLYTLTSCAVPGKLGGTQDPPIRLIELTVAGADTDGTTIAAAGENMDLTQFGVFSAKAGYWYAAMTLDNSVAGGPEATYKVDTGGTPAMGTVHNASKFGFFSFPDATTFGRYVFILNENNTIYRSALTGVARIGAAVPPGLAGTGFATLYQNWPDDANMKSYWAKLD
jgi:prepilin-type N-terminal cleavage/methylation domain-containing protein